MKPSDNIRKIFKQTKINTNKDTDKLVLDDAVKAMSESKNKTPVYNKSDVWRIIMQSRITKFAMAAVIIIAVLLGIPFDKSNVAWADVVEKFSSMSSYSAVVYAKKDASSEPIQFELWVSSEQKARLRVGSQVFFAEKGEVTAVFDFKEKKILKENQFNSIFGDYIKFVCNQKTFSLDTLVQLVQKGKLVETTPKINSAAIISEDLLVFDLDSSTGNEWMRIWALRESRLPIRFRTWNPDNGSSMDVFVNYEKQQSDEFFDHKKYEELLTKSDLKSQKEKANLAYAFLKDPGGKNYVPVHTFKNSQYHMPIVDDIGVTEYGAVWLATSKTENRRKDGRRFDGFSSVFDNLSRYYRRKYGSSSSFTGKGVHLYIPEDYPFDQRAVESFKLTCAFPRKDGEVARDYVGSIEITEWKQSSELPQEIKAKEYELIIQAGYDFSKKKEFEKVSKIVEMLKNPKGSDKAAYKLQQLELDVLIRQKKFTDASRLAKKLWPVEMDVYNSLKGGWPSSEFLIRYILAIAGNDEIDEASKLYKQIENAKPYTSGFGEKDKYFKNLLLNRLVRIKQNLYEFFTIAELSIDEINQIFGFDVRKNDETKWYVPEKYR